MQLTEQQIIARDKCLGSLLLFTQSFYKLRTGRDFLVGEVDHREPHVITIARALTKVARGEITRLNINIPPRYGKAIALDTPMLTQNGWSLAGDIRVGDKVVGSNGWTTITGVYPQGFCEAREMQLSDGQSVICNPSHKWGVYGRYSAELKTKTTEELENTLYERDGHKHWKLPLINGEFGEEKPFVNPYLLGCWLGDGHSHYAAITTMDREIVDAFQANGHVLRPHTHQNSGKAVTYGIVNNGFSSMLRKAGLLKNKHIPECVYRWKKADRLALLQGLMDTDGTCGKNGQVSFTNTNPSLIKGCGYLVNSLGGTYRIYTRTCGTQTLNIRLPDSIAPFRLERKQRYVSTGVRCEPSRKIKAIIPADPCEMVCFSVDAGDQLFAVGEGLILTHNTELAIHFVAWLMAAYPQSNFLYVSYSHELASLQTYTIRSIINLPEYRKLFAINVSSDSKAKDNFMTTSGGTVYAAGTAGTITGRGAGIKDSDLPMGAIIIDDSIKPDEATSDTIRSRINDWYYNTLLSRLNARSTPIINIGQRVHEDDLTAKFISDPDWHHVILPALDDMDNPLDPRMHTREELIAMREREPYVFAAQYMQDPQPAGGGIFKPEWFHLCDKEPEIISTLITVDTAETDKTYNDATVFSFFGIYKTEETGDYALHWIDCLEIRIEPKDLESEFMSFYAGCRRHKVPPSLIAIEKKSTGTTLFSVVSNIQGLHVIDISRSGYRKGNTGLSGKTARFLEMQPYIANRLMSLPQYGAHTNLCITHMKKITANNTHAHDDIADTAYDGIRIALIDKYPLLYPNRQQNNEHILKRLKDSHNTLKRLRTNAYGS